MEAQETAIRAQGLSKEFGNRWVLRAVDLDVAPGQSIALTGANGSGKTTLLRCLASLTRPTKGEVRWFGRLATEDPVARRLVGMVAHESRLYPHLSLRENLVFAARMCGVRAAANRADELLHMIGLATRGGSLPRQVSQGMRQRVSVARALVHEPRILLLDEPFAGLDPSGRDWLWDLMKGQQDTGVTICFATHDKTTERQLADRVFELEAGRLYALPVSRTKAGTDVPLWRRAA
jgi:heme ABC exporter ATP-binding subunit CcmA